MLVMPRSCYSAIRVTLHVLRLFGLVAAYAVQCRIDIDILFSVSLL